MNTHNTKLDEILKLNHLVAKLPDGVDIEINTEAAKQQINTLIYDIVMEIVGGTDTEYHTMQPVSPLFARNQLRAEIRLKAKELLNE